MPDLASDRGEGDGPDREEDARTGDAEIVGPEPEGARSYRVAGEVIQQSVTFRQAPYPTPDDLREYERIHPGFTDRILRLTEKETDHRIDQENRQESATIDLAKRGQIFAFVIVFALVVGGIAAILSDHSIVGFAGLVLAAATLAGAFIAPRVFPAGRQGANFPGTQIESPHDQEGRGR